MDLFGDIDTASAALVVQLQLEDAIALIQPSAENGDAPEAILSDMQFAFKMYKKDLECKASVILDRQMTNSIVLACQTDGEAITAELPREEAPKTIDVEELAKLEALYVSTPTITNEDVQDDTTIEGSQTSQERSCTACHDTYPFHELARAPCSHEYCNSCLQDLFQASMKDESLFPPRCCRQPIEFSIGVRLSLTYELVKAYEEKKIESETLNRTYCSNQLCSLFLQNSTISNEKAACPVCETVTCTICKVGAHIGDCPSDTVLQQVLEVAVEQGWQRCSNCHRLVELDTGCNHMTCYCGFEFCYVCGAGWKTCQCALWDERMLVARANQVIARQPPQLNAEEHEGRVAAAVENLRDRYNCNHRRRRRIQGPHYCEGCQHMLPEFILECRQCHLQACYRCLRNRL